MPTIDPNEFDLLALANPEILPDGTVCDVICRSVYELNSHAFAVRLVSTDNPNVAEFPYWLNVPNSSSDMYEKEREKMKNFLLAWGFPLDMPFNTNDIVGRTATAKLGIKEAVGNKPAVNKIRYWISE